jgi:hypothetical protein
MNRHSAILGLAVLICFAGCFSLSTDPRLVGSYSAGESETLLFLSDARVYHTQMVNGREESFFLGFYRAHTSNPNFVSCSGPDTSQFLGTSFQVSDDFFTVTASWNNLRSPKDSWQVVYRKDAEPK